MTPTVYCGWFRIIPGGHWRAVCIARTWDDCWAKLIDYRTEDGRVEKVVLPEGKHPSKE